MSVVDVVLGTLVLGLAGWALAQTGTAKPAGRGCGGGCGPGACGPEGHAEAEEPLVRLGGGGGAPERDREG